MLVQEDHDLPDDFLVGPTSCDLAGLLGSNPAYLTESFWGCFDDVEDVFAEHLHQSLGVDRSNPRDHAGSKVLLNAFNTGRCRGSQELCLELKPVRVIVQPDT